MSDDTGELQETFSLHDPLAEDLQRLVETWGLATVIHGLKVEVALAACGHPDEAESKRLESIAMQLDAAWCDAEGEER